MAEHELRVLITGVDEAGRGCVVSSEPLRLVAADQQQVWYATPFSSPAVPLPPRPPGRAPAMDLQVPSGGARWMVMDYAPGEQQGMHQTDTVDLDLVLDGSIELILDDGRHLLEAGDGVVINGIDHAWRAGTEGCRLSVVFLGSPPRS